MGSLPRVALVTCKELPEPDPDQDLQLRGLRDAGLDAEMLAWDDPDAAVDRFDLWVIRSTWNYHEHAERFLTWLDRLSAAHRLLNPRAVVRWNLHKRYLAKLKDAGIPVVPTVWIERGTAVELRTLARERGWSDVVVKPAVSAGSYRTRRFTADRFDEGHAFLRALLDDRDALVQAYMASTETGSERALVWIDGHFTHVVGKRPRFSGSDELVTAAAELTDRERAFGEQVLAAAPQRADLLYARVDVMTDADGAPCLSELELIEPSLFFLQYPPALARFVSAIKERVQR